MKGSHFANPSVPTIQDALVALAQRDDIPLKKRQRWARDALVACEWLGDPPDKTVAHAANLNPRFRRLSPARLKPNDRRRKSGKVGVSAKRVANVKHSVNCLLSCILHTCGRSFKAPLTDDWSKLEALIHNHYRRVTVRCFMQFASAQGIPPPRFDDGVSAAVLTALENERLRGDPRVTHQNAVRCWNWCVDHVPGWPLTRLTVPRYNSHYILPLSAFHPELVTAIERFLHWGVNDDPFDTERKTKLWSPRTEKTYRDLLRRYVSMLSHAGLDLQTLRSLADIVVVDTVERGLRWMLDRSDSKRGKVMAANMARLLAQIAKNPYSRKTLTPEEMEANNEMAAKIWKIAAHLHDAKALSRKTRERLTPLKDETNLATLFLLPFGLERSVAKSKKKGRLPALLMQWTVALMVLTFCPLRISTLCSISDRNLVWSRPGMRGELSFEIEEDQMKSGESASMPLPLEVARLIKLYIEKYRPLLVAGHTTFLFPGASADRPKGSGTMSTQLTRLIYKRTGFVVHPHLYRHMVHLVVLRQFPGAYAMVSRVLTHKSLDTAIRNYSYFDAELSMRGYHQLIREVQCGAAANRTANLSSIAYVDGRR